MIKGKYKCFNRRDFGRFLYFTVAACLIAIGVLLLVQKDIGRAHIISGLEYIAAISGIGVVAGFFLNSRSRFRPGWTLPMGIMLTFVGLAYIFGSIIPQIEKPSFSLSVVILLLSFANSCVLLSAAIQVFSLRLRRWCIYAAYSALSLAFMTMLYADLFGLKTNQFIGCSVFMFIFAFQLITDALIDLFRFNAVRNRFSSEVIK